MQLKSRGQGMIELVIAVSSVLMVLIILLPLLGKFIETKQTTDQAARYMAWERTIWFQSAPSNSVNAAVKSNDDLQREIHWRFFSKKGGKLSSDDSLESKKWTISANLEPMLSTEQTYGAKTVSLIRNENKKNEEQNGNSSGNSSNQSDDDSSDRIVTAKVLESKPSGVSPVATGILSLLDFGGFKVNRKGLQGSQVSIAYAELAGISPFDQNFNLTSTSSVYVLGNGWNSSGIAHNKKMVRALTPSALLSNMGFLNTVRNVLGVLPVARELKTDWLELGYVDTEALPEYRLCAEDGNNCQ